MWCLVWFSDTFGIAPNIASRSPRKFCLPREWKGTQTVMDPRVSAYVVFYPLFHLSLLFFSTFFFTPFTSNLHTIRSCRYKGESSASTLFVYLHIGKLVCKVKVDAASPLLRKKTLHRFASRGIYCTCCHFLF